MSGMMFWLGLAGGEVFLVIFVLLVVYWIRNSGAARRDRKAAAKLVATVRKGRAEREAAIDGFLSDQMGLSGNALEQVKAAMLREERRLLQRFADTYRRRDSGTAAQFHLDVEAALAPYFELQVSGGTVVSEGEGADAGELEALRTENERLREELSVTMDTMSRMLAEYSSMFAGGVPEASAGAAEPAPLAETDAPADEAEQAELPEREVPELDEAQLDIAGTEETGDEVDVAVAGETVDDAAEVADESVEELVDPDDIDQLIGADPLEEGLDSLFDNDDIAVLDDEPAEDVAKSDDDGAIAI